MSVEARLAALEGRLSAVEARLNEGGSGTSSASGKPGGRGPTPAADDSVLDGQWGDSIVIHKDPASWVEKGGESYAGCKMSECPSAYLEELAKFFDWQANKDEEKGKTYTNKRGQQVPTAPLRRADAAKARGWARRNANRQPPAQSSSDFGGSSASDDDIPF